MKIKRAVIKQAREKAGLSQEDLARRCRVVQATISAIETGETPHPRMDTLASICRVLKLEVTDLI